MPALLIDICSRLKNPVTLAGVVAVEFDLATTADCRVSGIPWLYVLNSGNDRVGFLNQLQSFNYILWGCASPPPSEFALIYEPGLVEDPRPITSADVSALIEDYLAVATPRLQLSAKEIASLEARLFSLSETVVTLESSGYSRTDCAEGGASGAGGESGAGGAPEVAGAGGA